ncbi:unnamed protein product [Lepeophtheirus salmonis]|uniref:(salmon louse) hypothetical protein n=1 Tax=Lepeophtheirus salmonis TaxID=72036 RepID=A0A7R8CQ45_LEPSM|nr:unnamed protein product [Lepeophtheirus salmonis]CAF2891806.1 unnamed protein product [Lepeophtheirus salmonis]
MRVTADAKSQLKDLLIKAGFPEECMIPQCYNFSGPDGKLDVVIALLIMGLYPNICMHKEKRKVLTTEAREQLLSINLRHGNRKMNRNYNSDDGPPAKRGGYAKSFGRGHSSGGLFGNNTPTGRPDNMNDTGGQWNSNRGGGMMGGRNSSGGGRGSLGSNFSRGGSFSGNFSRGGSFGGNLDRRGGGSYSGTSGRGGGSSFEVLLAGVIIPIEVGSSESFGSNFNSRRDNGGQSFGRGFSNSYSGGGGNRGYGGGY